MRLLGVQLLSDFMRKHAHARSPLEAWIAEARDAAWETPADVKARYRSVSIVNEHYVFNIGGNKYRLDTRINFVAQIILALRIGTHEQYNAWKF